MTKYTNAVFIDFVPETIKENYLARIKSVFKSVIFVKSTETAFEPKIRGGQAIFVRRAFPIDKKLIDKMPSLKYIGVLSTAHDLIDINYARNKGITVCNLGGYSTESVAEFFFGVILENIRKISEAKQPTLQQEKASKSIIGFELMGKTLGIIGAGRIGTRIGEIGAAFGMRIKYYSRNRNLKLDSLGAAMERLDKVISESNIISLNLALNEQTNGIVDKDKIKLFKSGSIFVCLADINLINLEALIDRLTLGNLTFISDHIPTASLLLEEKLLASKNVISYLPVTTNTREASIARWETFVANIEAFAKGLSVNEV